MPPTRSPSKSPSGFTSAIAFDAEDPSTILLIENIPTSRLRRQGGTAFVYEPRSVIDAVMVDPHFRYRQITAVNVQTHRGERVNILHRRAPRDLTELINYIEVYST